MTVDCEEHFPSVFQNILPTPISDHFPICLETTKWERGKTPFRFENTGLEKTSDGNFLALSFGFLLFP